MKEEKRHLNIFIADRKTLFDQNDNYFGKKYKIKKFNLYKKQIIIYQKILLKADFKNLEKVLLPLFV